MPKITDSFKYEPNGLFLIEYDDLRRSLDYYNKLISFYQQERKTLIEKEGSFEDKQLVKERYESPPTFISHISPFSKNELIFSNRKNGYFAYTDMLKNFDPFTDKSLPVVDNFLEYLSTIQDTISDGFFFIKDKRAFYGFIYENHLFVSLSIQKNMALPLLYFCESYTYVPYASDNDNKAVGEVTVSFPFMEDVTLLVYTEESIYKFEKYTPIIINNGLEPVKEFKAPGYPVFKTIFINGYDEGIEGIKINGITIDNFDYNINYKIPCDNVYNKNIILKRNYNNLDFTFTFPLLEVTPPKIVLKIELLVEGSWKVFETPVLYLKNEFSSFIEKIKIDGQEIYVNVPTPYTIRLSKDPYNELIEKADWNGRYDKTVKEIFPKFVGNGNKNDYIYDVPEFTIDSIKGERPKEFIFSLEGRLYPINGLTSYYWASGYNTNDIMPVPENIIIVKPEILDVLSYREFDLSKYKIKFTARGTLTLVDVKIKYIEDDLKYFNESDFKLEKISDADQVLEYYLVLNNKVFLNPVNLNETNLKITFKYDVKRKDETILTWPAETISSDMEISYYKDRWEIKDINIQNKLIGATGIQFRIFDKLLGKFTNKFSSDERLILNGKMEFSNNVVSISNGLIWDMRNQIWQWNVNITKYGNVTLQYVDTVAVSDKVVVKHDKPTHPLNVKQKAVVLYTNVYGRVRFDLSFNDVIRSISVNGSLITNDIPMQLKDVNDEICYLNAIYSPDKTTITGLGIDFMPLKVGTLSTVFNVTGVNDFDYNNWTAPINMSVEVKNQKDKINYELIVESFQYSKNCVAYIKTFDNTLSTAQIVANLISVKTGKIVGYPNFDPIENGDFKSTNFFIDSALKDEKEFLLSFTIYEYDYVKKDNNYPNRQVIKTELSYKVTI